MTETTTLYRFHWPDGVKSEGRGVDVADALEKLVEAAGDDETLTQTLTLMKELNSRGGFEEVPFESVWNIIQAMAKTAD